MPTEALFGRARELVLLGGLIRELTGGAAATVLVEGEAGIGKTRLLMSAIECRRRRRRPPAAAQQPQIAPLP